MPRPSISTSTPRPPSPTPSTSQQAPLKITLLGPASSGKTALRYRYVRGEFQKSYRATIGCDFLTRTLKLPLSESGENVQEVETQVWDTAGQERFKSISLPFFRGSQALVLTFDYTTPVGESLKQLKMWFEEFRGKCDTVRDLEEKEKEKFCWVLVGCKMDLVGEDERRKVEKKLRKCVKGWFDEQEGQGEELVKGKDFQGNKVKKVKTKLDIGPRQRSIPITKPVPFDSASSPPGPSSSTHSNSTIRPTLSSQSTSSTIASIELSSSLPTPQALNPSSLLLMATSPPHPPISVEPNGHPKAIYQGGPYNQNQGHLLEDQEEHVSQVQLEEGNEESGSEEEEQESLKEEGSYERDGFKFFRTSAKTGEGVEQVFQYCARRILYNLSITRDAQSRSPRSEGDKGVIRINERDGNLSTGMKLRRACCT
ncbi:hypothetical protein JCM5353_007403 [Sporobolomyces roseus]